MIATCSFVSIPYCWANWFYVTLDPGLVYSWPRLGRGAYRISVFAIQKLGVDGLRWPVSQLRKGQDIAFLGACQRNYI